MVEVRIMIWYGGEWISSENKFTYNGIKTRTLLAYSTSTMKELLDKLYHLLGVKPDEYDMKLNSYTILI